MNLAERLDEYYENYIELRKSLGYSGNTIYPVVEFIKYCTANFPNETAITKHMFDAWLSQRTFRTNSNHADAITRLRMFLRYLISVGESAFVPGEDYSVRVEKFMPYIFTDEELTRLFDAFDMMPQSPYSPNREHIIPVMFRMMYCCGMRPGEPISIQKEDFDLNSGEIYIRQSKGYKDRRILISDDLLRLCRKYAGHMPSKKYFFERSPGVKIPIYWVADQFGYAWELSGLVRRTQNPRPYDLRHNFTARSIIRWVNEGKDVAELMPFLSAYLGHTDLASTLYYVHLVPERLLNNKGIDWKRFEKIYTEVSK